MWSNVTYIPRDVTLGANNLTFKVMGRVISEKKIIIIIFVTSNSAWSRVFRQPNYTAPLFRRPVLT